MKVHTENLTQKIHEKLKDEFIVGYGMRYGKPSIQSEIEKLQKACTHITVVPLYPQYASSSTGSSLAKIYQEISKNWDPMNLKIMPAFFNHPDYIQSLQ